MGFFGLDRKPLHSNFLLYVIEKKSVFLKYSSNEIKNMDVNQSSSVWRKHVGIGDHRLFSMGSNMRSEQG